MDSSSFSDEGTLGEEATLFLAVLLTLVLLKLIRMSECSEVQCQNAFVRAELSGLLFRDKASQPCYALMKH